MDTLSLLTSFGFIQIFGLKLCARPGFLEDSQRNETDNSGFLREAFSLVGFKPFVILYFYVIK